MTFDNLRPILWTDKFDETIEFYVSTLGFTCAERNDDWGWAQLNRDSVELMLAIPNEHAEFTGTKFTGSFYINVDDVDGLWEHVREKARICYEPATFDWGMYEFAIYDNNGYLLQFGCEITGES